MTIFFTFFTPDPGKAADLTPALVKPGILLPTLSGFLVTLLTALSFSLASGEGFTITEDSTFSVFFAAFFFIPALSSLPLQSELFALQSKEITLANSFDADPEFLVLLGEICTSFGTLRGEGGVYSEGFSSIRCHTDNLVGAIFCGARLGEPGSIVDMDIGIFLFPLLSLCATKPSWLP